MAKVNYQYKSLILMSTCPQYILLQYAELRRTILATSGNSALCVTFNDNHHAQLNAIAKDLRLCLEV